MARIDGGGPETVLPAVPDLGEYLVRTYRADTDVIVIELTHGPMTVPVLPGTEGAQPACRCYRCGSLLTADTVRTSGGPFRGSIRPACEPCDDLVRGK